MKKNIEIRNRRESQNESKICAPRKAQNLFIMVDNPLKGRGDSLVKRHDLRAKNTNPTNKPSPRCIFVGEPTEKGETRILSKSSEAFFKSLLI